MMFLRPFDSHAVPVSEVEKTASGAQTTKLREGQAVEDWRHEADFDGPIVDLVRLSENRRDVARVAEGRVVVDALVSFRYSVQSSYPNGGLNGIPVPSGPRFIVNLTRSPRGSMSHEQVPARHHRSGRGTPPHRLTHVVDQ